jgi:hypothetical protein
VSRPHIEFVQASDAAAVVLPEGPFSGSRCRVLSEDGDTGAWTGLLELLPGRDGHLGCPRRLVELFVLQGYLWLGGRRLAAGHYAYEPSSEAAATLTTEDAALVLVMVEPGPGSGEAVSVDTSTLRYRPSGRHAEIPPGIVNKLLRVDPATGDETWLAAVAPEWMESRAEIHPTVEECFMIRGDILLGTRGVMGPGSYFWRPPMVRHGPMYSRTGGLFFFRSKGGRLGVDYEDVPGWQEVVEAYARTRTYFEVLAGRGYQPIVDGLQRLTAASRVTVRMHDGRGSFPVVAETLSRGTRSIAGETGIDLRSAPTFQYLERELCPLVQEDILASDIAPPPGLVERYGVRSQILAPVVQGGQMIGFISVHHSHVRRWNVEEIAAVEFAASRLAAGGTER